MAKPKAAQILIVDQGSRIGAAINAQLVSAGYCVTRARSATQAIRAFDEHPADLALLDLEMPGKQALETCRRIRGIPEGAGLPIIFLAAPGDQGSRAQALAAGADDFLPRTPEPDELLIRTRSLLRLKWQKDKIEKECAVLRARLEASRRTVRQQDEYLHFVAHDLSNPAMCVRMNAEILLQDGTMPEQCRSSLCSIRECSTQIEQMVSSLAFLGRGDDGQLKPRCLDVDVEGLIEQAREGPGSRIDRLQQKLSVDIGLEQRTIQVDRDLIHQTLENLIDNASRHTPPRGAIFIEARSGDKGWIEIRIHDQGPSLSEEFRERIFDRYLCPSEMVAAGYLREPFGLPFCRLATEIHGGRIWVERHEENGNAFCLRLPVLQRA